jgi:hypothetical protein
MAYRFYVPRNKTFYCYVIVALKENNVPLAVKGVLLPIISGPFPYS